MNNVANNLKNAGRSLVSGLSGVVKTGAKAVEVAANLSSNVINTSGRIGKAGIKATGTIGEEAFAVSESVARGSRIMANSVVGMSSKVVASAANEVAENANATLRASGKVYRSLAEQSAELASSAIKASTAGLVGIMDLMGEKERSWAEGKRRAEVDTRGIYVEEKVRKQFNEEMVRTLTELTIGVVAAINTYMIVLSEIRHLIFMEKNIAHIWMNDSGRRYYVTMKRRTENADRVEEKVREIWQDAKRERDSYEKELKRFITVFSSKFNRLMIGKMNANKMEMFADFLEDAVDYIAELYDRIEESYDDLEEELEELHGEMNFEEIIEDFNN